MVITTKPMMKTAMDRRWLANEEDNHINILKLHAILLGLKILVRVNKPHIRIHTDNTTAMAYIRNMGGTKLKPCNTLAIQIWEKALWKRAIVHYPGKYPVDYI